MKWACLPLMVLLVACGGSPATAVVTPTHRAPGPLGDTWLRTAGTWHALTGNGPSSRYAAALAYDGARQMYVLFGGQTQKGSVDDTWVSDGRTWKLVSPAHKPAARRAATMAYDTQRQVVVLYGGLVQDRGEGSPASDTWVWDGSDWKMVESTNASPGARIGSKMVSTPRGVVLFGGSVFNNDQFFADAWTWDGARWTRIDRAPTPPGRNNAAAAWNEVDSSLFVYGGSGLNPAAAGGAAGKPLSDSWLLKGATWEQISATGPTARAQANALWDASARRVLVMFGMTGVDCPQPTNEVWAWDGTSWSRLASAAVPVRWGAALAQAADGSALLFGGSDEPGC
jgi:hypothetical protein